MTWCISANRISILLGTERGEGRGERTDCRVWSRRMDWSAINTNQFLRDSMLDRKCGQVEQWMLVKWLFFQIRPIDDSKGVRRRPKGTISRRRSAHCIRQTLAEYTDKRLQTYCCKYTIRNMTTKRISTHRHTYTREHSNAHKRIAQTSGFKMFMAYNRHTNDHRRLSVCMKMW